MSLSNDLHRMKQQALGVSVDALAELSQIGARRLSPYLGGTRGLPAVELERLEKTLSDLNRLAQVASPFPLSYRNVAVIRDLLERMRNGEFEMRQQHASPI